LIQDIDKQNVTPWLILPEFVFANAPNDRDLILTDLNNSGVIARSESRDVDLNPGLEKI